MKVKAPPGLVQESEGFLPRAKRKAVSVFLFLRNEPHFYQFLISILVIFLFLIFLPSAKIQRVENSIHDLFYRHRTLKVHPAIAVIEVAEDSLQSLGRWPWSRNYHAGLTHILNEWGASAIVFDVLFTESALPQEDKAFQEALLETKNSYFAAALEPHDQTKIWMQPIPEFKASAKGIGHINIVPDEDGTLRRIRPYLKQGTEGFPHIALRVAYDYLGQSIDFEKEKPFPLDQKGNLLINWAGPWKKTFEHYSYVDLLLSYQALKSGRNPVIRPDQIKGKICLIGITATGLADIKANPLEGAYPALGVHANVINSVLTNHFVRLVPVRFHVFILLSIGLNALFFLIPFRNILSLCMISLMTMGWVLISYLLFTQKGILIFTLQPIILIITLYIFSAVFALVIANKERFHFFQLATRDGLTGLYVIRHFRTILSEEIARASKLSEPLAVVLIDIDDFKKVNDTYGHQAGDMVLRGTAQQVESSVRYKRVAKEMDYVARYGGEEIIILLHKSNLMDAAFKVAERIRKAVEQMSYTWENARISPTISLGVSALRPGDTADSLIRRADEALYRAKKEGKNRVCIEERGLLREKAEAKLL